MFFETPENQRALLEWPGIKYKKPQVAVQKSSYENRKGDNSYRQTNQSAYGRGTGHHNGTGPGRRPGAQNRPSPRWTDKGNPICLLCNKPGHIKAHCRSKAGKPPDRRK